MPGATTPTAEQIAWMLSHPDDSLVPNIIACGTIALIFATVSITLRLVSRKIARRGLDLRVSDWFAIAAWVCIRQDKRNAIYLFYVIYISTFISVTRYGGGRHVVFVTNPRLLGILYIAQENLYAATSALLKFSILSLYRELFTRSRNFYLCTWAVTALVTEWLIQVVLATNLQCIPISASWDPSVHATCINYGIEALVAYLINISTDLMTLSMPIPLILKLQVSKTYKRRLIISFATEWVSIGSIVPSSLLGTVELMVGFFAASIATYGPLYRFVFSDSPGRNKLVGTGSTSGNASNIRRRGMIVPGHIELTRHNSNVNDESELLARN
ncbi:hypothetical protein F5Y10DRAFT_282885 [Nemania abortiva]|nr:hypothetical protein F5Y10DRAFT_282885 [Nemania abortiva]